MLFGFLFVGPMKAQPTQNPTLRQFQAEQIFQEGMEYYNSNQLQRALESFNEVIRLDPSHPKVYELRGETYYRLERFDAAFADYQRASRLNPTSAKLKNDMGVAAARLGQYRTAIKYFTESLRLDPQYPDAKKNQALARQRLEEGVASTYPNYSSANDPWFGNANSGLGNSDPFNSDPYNPGNGSLDPGYGFDPVRGGDLQGPILDLDSLLNLGTTPPVDRPPNLDITYVGDRLSVGGQADPYISIDKVQITPQGTEISFSLENPSTDPYPIRLGQPGSPEAWMIVDRTMQRRYPLVQLQNIFGTGSDEPYELPAGQRTVIIARFDRIADDMSVFHVLEGNDSFKGAWNFWEVKLRD